MMLKLPMKRNSEPIAPDVSRAESSVSCFAFVTVVVSPPGSSNALMRSVTASDSAAPASVPPRFEISVLVNGRAVAPDSAASRSSVPRGKERVRVDRCTQARAGKALARHDVGHPHRRRLAEDEEEDVIADACMQTACELVVDHDLARAGGGSGET